MRIPVQPEPPEDTATAWDPDPWKTKVQADLAAMVKAFNEPGETRPDSRVCWRLVFKTLQYLVARSK